MLNSAIIGDFMLFDGFRFINEQYTKSMTSYRLIQKWEAFTLPHSHFSWNYTNFHLVFCHIAQITGFAQLMWQGTEEQAAERHAFFFCMHHNIYWAHPGANPHWDGRKRRKTFLPIHSFPVDKPTRFQFSMHMNYMT